MSLWQRLYYLGMVLAMLLVVTGELIWLPDPMRFGAKIYWIDVIDLMIYVLALVPLIWMIGSLLHLFSQRSAWARVRSGAVCVAGMASVSILLTIPEQVEYSASVFALTWILVFVDLFFHERMRRKFPAQSISIFVSTLFLLFMMCLII